MKNTVFRFGDEFKLKTKSDFSYLQKNAKRDSAPFLKVYFKKHRFNKDDTRVGFAISRKVGKANVRNRLKRIFREEFRQSKFKNESLDAVFVVLPSLFKKIEDQQYGEKIIRESFQKLLAKISVQNGTGVN